MLDKEVVNSEIDLEIKPQEKQEKTEWTNESVMVIVLLNKNFDFKSTRTPYDIDICGKKMWEWVALSSNGCVTKTTVCTEESDILTLVKPYLDVKYKWTVVLYSDTPLFSHATFVEIMDYVRAKEVNALTLERGYVFNTEYISKADKILGGITKQFGSTDFYTVTNNEQLLKVKQIIQKRILDFHVDNGVIIDDRNSCFIDAEVIIESGTRIYPNNMIYGSTYIGKNCVIEPNNIIKDSVISNNCNLKYSYVEESRISDNIVVGPFESIVKKST